MYLKKSQVPGSINPFVCYQTIRVGMTECADLHSCKPTVTCYMCLCLATIVAAVIKKYTHYSILQYYILSGQGTEPITDHNQSSIVLMQS